MRAGNIVFVFFMKLQDNFLYERSLGNETKLGMSRGVPEPKLTAMDAMIDKLTGAIFIFQIVVVVVLGIAGNVWKDTEARKVRWINLLDFLLAAISLSVSPACD